MPNVQSLAADATTANPVARSEERVLVVHGAVLDTVGHVLGNLFQRIYHLVDRVGESDSLTAEELRGNVGRLEGVLQQFLDYVSPLATTLQPVSFADLAQSCGRSVGEACGGRLRVEINAPDSGEVLVDPGRVVQAFDLMTSWLQVRPGGDAASRAALIEASASARWLHIKVSLPAEYVAARNSEAELRWALAEKIIDLHGGTLTQSNPVAGEILWLITLPLQL